MDFTAIYITQDAIQGYDPIMNFHFFSASSPEEARKVMTDDGAIRQAYIDFVNADADVEEPVSLADIEFFSVYAVVEGRLTEV